MVNQELEWVNVIAYIIKIFWDFLYDTFAIAICMESVLAFKAPR